MSSKEYRVERFYPFNDTQNKEKIFEDGLNRTAKDGWVLITVMKEFLIFERVVLEPNVTSK